MALNENMCFNEDISNQELPTWKFWKKRRYVVATLAFFGFFNTYLINVNLGETVVAAIENNTIYLFDDFVEIDDSKYDPSGETRNIVFSSFFYGYIVTQLPGGWLANRFGGNKVFGIGIGAATLLTLVTPLLEKSTPLLITVRVLAGLLEGVTYPSIYAIWARWAPPLERSRLTCIAFSGTYIGAFLSVCICGYLVRIVGHHILLYSFGMFSLIWSVIWWRVVKESPELDPKITQIELEYIQNSLGNKPNLHRNFLKYPWRDILKSGPVWAIVAAHFSEVWGFYTLLMLLPVYIDALHYFRLSSVGLLFAVPYLFIATVLPCAGYLADWLQCHKYLNTTQVRKLFNCSALIVQSILTVGATYIGGPVGCIICMWIGIGLCGFAWSGFSVNHLDIAPQYASVLMGISNTIATLSVFIAPLVPPAIVYSGEGWSKVLFISGGINLIGAIIYGTFGSGIRQPWAIEEEIESPQSDTERSSTSVTDNIYCYTNLVENDELIENDEQN